MVVMPFGYCIELFLHGMVIAWNGYCMECFLHGMFLAWNVSCMECFLQTKSWLVMTPTLLDVYNVSVATVMWPVFGEKNGNILSKPFTFPSFHYWGKGEEDASIKAE